MRTVEAPHLADIRAAAARLVGKVRRTPLVPFEIEDVPAEIYLKLENLQPIGSFKLRGAGNAIELLPSEVLAHGVYTASAGNMAQGVAWTARRLGIPAAAIVPENAPQAKLAAIKRLGARAVPVPFAEWWQVLVEHEYPGMGGRFVHPVSDPAVIAGNGTIGLEILEDLPDVETILVPFGGGGLSSGIAIAARELRPEIRILACEVETAPQLAASFSAGEPRSVEHVPSFVDGIGGKGVLEEMWPLVSELIDGSVVVPIAEVARAVRLLAERAHVVAEGAGAVPVAAALSGEVGGKVVCVISGGNINPETLARILRGEVP